LGLQGYPNNIFRIAKKKNYDSKRRRGGNIFSRKRIVPTGESTKPGFREKNSVLHILGQHPPSATEAFGGTRGAFNPKCVQNWILRGSLFRDLWGKAANLIAGGRTIMKKTITRPWKDKRWWGAPRGDEGGGDSRTWRSKDPLKGCLPLDSFSREDFECRRQTKVHGGFTRKLKATKEAAL